MASEKPAGAPPAADRQQAPPSAGAGTGATEATGPGVAYEPLDDDQDAQPAAGAGGLTRVALLVPLSGQAEHIGQALLNAAEMALFDVADERFVLQPYDTQGTADGAQAAAALALSHGAQLILGPVFSNSVQAVAPQARAGNVNMVAFSTDPGVAGDGVYVAGFLLREQVRRLVEHARTQGLDRFAALAPDNAFGRMMVKAYEQAVRRMGGTLTRVEFYGPDPAEIAEVVQRLGDYEQRKAALERQRRELEARGDAAAQEALKRLERRETMGDLPFDALLLAESGSKLREVASLLPYYDIDTSQAKLMGPMLWADPSLAREPALVGAWYPAPPPDTHEDFERRYREAFGHTPPQIASLGYDLTALAAVLARQDGPAAFTERTLTNPNGFAGIDGLFRFLADGTSERGFAVMEIRPGGNVQVGPAPQAFTPQVAPASGGGYIEAPRPSF